MSSAVGRPVDIGAAHLRVLPRPGFNLENLVVYDDPAFGAEPMLRASEVTADLRLTSLLRGRIEIARLELTDPSLNLVHADNGRWNLEALVERTEHTPLAPTGKAKSEPRPAFPYIEATSARINFKNGPEKKPFALTNADFSLWQDSENTWGVRLIAQPVRTDLNLNDIGLIRVNGTWQRAATLRETPLNFHIEWRRGQLGQLTKLFTRNDQGWRGGIDFETTLAGTPAALNISTNAAIADFRRYDLTNGEALRLAAHCDGQYSSVDHTFREVLCSAPVGAGIVALKGAMGLPGSQRYDLMLMAENIPASALVALAQRTKKNLPEDLTADGALHGSVAIRSDGGSPLRVEGRGEIEDFHLVSVLNKAEIGPQTVPFVLGSDRDDSGGIRRRTSASKLSSGIPATPTGPHVQIGPIAISSGHTTTAILRGWADRSTYNFAITGETEIAKALRVAHLVGLPALNTSADGVAQVDLQFAGTWPGLNSAADFQPGHTTGTVKLRNVRVLVRGAEEPVEISSADLRLGPEATRVEKLSASAAGTLWSGSLDVPRGCGTPAACEVLFNLKADRIALHELSNWASPLPKQQPWYRALESSPQTAPSLLASLRASGRLATARLQVPGLAATRVSANVNLGRGKLQVSEFTADVLGGTHRGMWMADFSVKPAVCRGSGDVSDIQLSHLADAETTVEIMGTASGTYQVSGTCGVNAETTFRTASFWKSAEGTFQFDVQDGVAPRISLMADEGPLRFTRLSGQAKLHDGEFDVKDAKLNTQDGKLLLSGSASLQREIALKLTHSESGSGGYTITGTLAEPQVAPLPGPEQARLKP